MNTEPDRADLNGEHGGSDVAESTLQVAVRRLIDRAYSISEGVGEDLEALLSEIQSEPVDRADLASLLRRLLDRLRVSARQRGDEAAVALLSRDTEEMVNEALGVNDRVAPYGESHPNAARAGQYKVELQALNGAKPGPVLPTPVFRGRPVPMRGGYVKTTDIQLWHENVRLEVHLRQFEIKYGRGPTAEELLDVMMSHTELPGIREENQFKIPELARSIALNGVQRPPIVGLDGTLYDGNRRVTACHYILNSDEFSPEQKKRAEHIFVWQLTEHASDEDIDAVVVALNFEPDHKQEWPTYVKAQKVAEEWASMMALEGRAGPKRQAEMKRALSERFALGPDTSTVNRWLRMVDWANEFEDYHVQDRRRDQYEVKHRAANAFEYFDELSKGSKPGGVAWSLNQDDALKHMVFDLLFEGRFRNWSQIRSLKYVYDDEDAREALRKARDEEDPEEAEEHLENAMALARQQKAEQRELGANTKIERFVDWLEKLPVRAFRDQITDDNLVRLLRALRLVESHVEAQVGVEGAEQR